MDPATAARIALLVKQHKGTIVKIVLAFLLIPILLTGCLTVMVAGMFGVASATDAQCAAQQSDAAAAQPNPIAQAAADLGASPTAATLLQTLAAARAAAMPAESIGAAGPFRLPLTYAAGRPGGPGRWQGPVDPAVGKDSRGDVVAATRAVMRRLLRTAPAWRDLVHAAAPQTEEDRTAVAQRFIESADLAFGTALDVEQLASVLASPAGSTEAPKGDARIGGVLVIGDPIRASQVAAVLGPRAFGGPVVVAESSGDPAQVSDAVERDLAGARGTVLAVVDQVPTPGEMDDLASSTPATAAWISAAGAAAPAGVAIAGTAEELRAVLVDLTSGTDAAGQFFALCGALPGVGLADAATIDPASIVAPDTQAQYAIAYAHEQIGKPYVDDPPRARPPNSWDCSKLTSAAWAVAGVRLTPLSYTQAEEVQSIPRALVEPGDLVFWLRSGAHHVALVDQVDASGQVWITEAANPSAGVRRRALGGSWDDTYLSGFGRVIRSTELPTSERNEQCSPPWQFDRRSSLSSGSSATCSRRR